jgi:hypothetical protein
MMWLSPDLLRRTLPVPVKRNRFAAQRYVFIFGMTLPEVLRLPGPRVRPSARSS